MGVAITGAKVLPVAQGLERGDLGGDTAGRRGRARKVRLGTARF